LADAEARYFFTKNETATPMYCLQMPPQSTDEDFRVNLINK